MKYLIILMFLFLGCGQDHSPSDEEVLPPQSRELDQSPPALQETAAATKFKFLTNLSSHIRDTGVYKLHNEGYYGQGLRVAILDNGFSRLEDALGKSLPPNLKIEPYPQNEPLESEHGTRMTEIVYSLATGSTVYSKFQKSPEILLYNTNGFTNFKHAVAEVIKQKVDLVLYSQVWQYGGNFDGKGFINAEVSKATARGIVWVNAAGNFANTSYSTEIKVDGAGNVILPDSGNSLKFSSSYPNLPLKIVASWSDYGETEFSQSLIDLDLFVYDSKGNMRAKSELIQDASRKESGKKSRYPREIIFEPFASGEYMVRLKLRGSRALPPNIEVRISIEGDGTKINQTQKNRSLMIPADNPAVIAVGAADYIGSSEDSLTFETGKPEILSNSFVEFSDGYSIRSSSTAAAVVAGSLLPFMLKNSLYDRKEILSALSKSESLNLMVNQPKSAQRQVMEMPQIPSNQSNQRPSDSHNSVANAGDMEYPLPETWQGGNVHDRPQRDEAPRGGNAPQNDPYDRPERPSRQIPPEHRQPERGRPQQPDRQEDIPPFRAVH